MCLYKILYKYNNNSYQFTYTNISNTKDLHKKIKELIRSDLSKNKTKKEKYLRKYWERKYSS